MSTPHDDLDAQARAGPSQLPATGGRGELGRPELDSLDQLFEVMVASRHLDLEARRMRERGEGYYTIGLAGHESSAYIGAGLRSNDPALLHYRSGGFYLSIGWHAGSRPTGFSAASLI